jgi:hypothetical protein
VKDSVGVCVNGKAVAWSAAVKPPHMHESGGYYGAVEDLARALGVHAEVAADQQSVKVGGKSVVAVSKEAKGVHTHDSAVFVPIKEFAEAAGYHVVVDAAQHTISMSK